MSKSEYAKATKLNSYPFWSPRFWHGMRTRTWLRLWWPNAFRIHPLRIPMAFIVTLIALINSVLFRLQNWRYGSQIESTAVELPPLFIIGHWRSGTTYLHELIVRDTRLAFPTTYECFAPSHFLITSRLLPPLIRFLLPRKRPMDNMETGLEHPQEDEFALCALGAPTPYLRMAFPNATPPYLEFLDMNGVDARDLARWKEAMQYFVRALTLGKQGKRIVLKSPPHTGRIRVLRELFPGAQFVHIVRDPFAIYPSTVRLWGALDQAQGFQFPKHDYLDEYVFQAFERMYGGFREQAVEVDTTDLCEVRYEDLIRNPVDEVRRIYEQLRLGNFEPLGESLQKFVTDQREYRPNQHQLSAAKQAEIEQRWKWYFERYGYKTGTYKDGKETRGAARI